MPKGNNYPQAALDAIEPSSVHETVTSLKQLYDLGRPKTDFEVEDRINKYFEFCEHSSVRPGIETLCMALHISRQMLYKWAAGECSEVRQELAQSAKAFISAYIEQAMLSGKINPASGIFLMKNWLSYKDTVSIEEALPLNVGQKALSATELPKLGKAYKDISALPDLGQKE